MVGKVTGGGGHTGDDPSGLVLGDSLCLVPKDIQGPYWFGGGGG
jgi:hypothetical protein